MTGYASQAIKDSMIGSKVFCKFLSANDTGITGGHQCGIYIGKQAVPILFDKKCVRGTNYDKNVKIVWQNDFTTDSRFIYYGKGTRNEYRITRFGRGFELLDSQHTGALFVLIQLTSEDYKAYVLDTEQEIEEYLIAFNISSTETNNLLNIKCIRSDEEEIEHLIDNFVKSLGGKFPCAEKMSSVARNIENSVYDHERDVLDKPDSKILKWTAFEYRIFRALEFSCYGEKLKNGFADIEDFINLANTVLNRRKSRAGKSLENHLDFIFKTNRIKFDTQAVTENNKRPDFIFPSVVDYHNSNFPVEKIVTLAAKTTCKDRWRQILNEADRLRNRSKFLCTLQQGISLAQMNEMESEQVILVVPAEYIGCYPVEVREKIWSLKKFIEYVKEIEKT